MQWFESILESGGELIGGAVDVVGDVVNNVGQDWLGIKLGYEAERADSANPESNRDNQNDYQEANGAPVQGSAGTQSNTQLYLIAGVGVAVAAVAAMVYMKGGK
ncbi:hypothetical protein ST37_01755 (plasmid) [Vibrio sp. qd031]|uniref:hypothetical protein n=1 Tax=Vibrio sp. qd031 TaxID=1603038 RepID=UPI000A114C02|nr:hypothetical protein [Vibrio sp. qd031]ORT52521.1 hypothetical protein ST37_01755 [Vibrio sp. qd031]